MRTRFCLNLLLLSSLLLPILAKADSGSFLLPDPEPRCGSVQRNSADFFSCRARRLLSHLRDLGVKRFACRESSFELAIEDALRGLDQVTFRLKDSGNDTPAARSWTAFYLPSHKTVLLNSQRVIAPYAAPALALHETLGALGISESRYQISFLTALLYPNALDPATAERFGSKILHFLENLACPDQTVNFYPPPFTKHDGKLTPGDLARGGSGDVVGSGGDPNVIELKVRLARDLLASSNDAKGAAIIVGLQRADFFLSDSSCDPCPAGSASCDACYYNLKTMKSELGFTAFVSRAILLNEFDPENSRRSADLYERLRTAFDSWVVEEYSI